MATTEVGSLVADFVIPGVDEVIVVALSQAEKLVQQMKENEEMCWRVYKRMKFVYEELLKLTDDTVIREKNVLAMYGENMANFLAFLEKHSQKGFIKRLAGNRKVLEALQDFHADMDELFRLLNIAHMAEMNKLRQQWEEDQASAHKRRGQILESNEAVKAEIQEQSNNTTEGMALILYELQSMQDRNTAEQLALMKRAFGKVVTMSKAKVPAVPEWFIPSDDVELDAESFFDIGSYGSVHRGTYGKGTNVVIKRLLTDDQDAKESFFREVEVWSKLNNPHIVRLFGACHVSTPAFFVCEDATGGNFVDRFDKDKSELWRLFYEAALGLFYLHSQKVVHGDLKCNNIVIGADNRAKLIDFGFSFVRTQSVGLSAKSQTEAIRWKAPECMLPEEEEPNPQFNRRFASDVYSFGMCIIEAFLGEHPYGFEDDDTVMGKKYSGEMYPRVENMTDEEWDFMTRLLAPEWTSRMSLNDAIDTLKAFADREAAAKAVDGAAPVTFVSAGLGAVALSDPIPQQEKHTPAASTRSCPSCAARMPIEFNFCGECTAAMLSRLKAPQAPVLLECVSERCAVKILSTYRFCRQCGVKQGATAMGQSSSNDISSLLALVTSGNDAQKENAARALWNLALKTELRDIIVDQSGAVGQLVNLASEGTQRQREYAAGALGFLASHLPGDVKIKIAIQGGIEALLLWIIRPENTELIHEGLLALQGLCTDGNDTVRAVVKKLKGHLTLGLIRERGNERDKILADKIFEWLNFTGLSELCQHMGEAEPLCSHVMERIKTLQDSGVDTVGAARTRLRAVLIMNGDKSMIFRIVSARSLSETLADLHREVDLLQSETSREVWVSQWELDKSAMMQKLFDVDIPTLINRLCGDAAAQHEALMLLVHEVEQNKTAYTKQQRAFLNVILSRLAGFSSEGIPVDEKWFIPRTDVQYGDESFSGGAFGKVYHGKYMNADVVIKCVEIKSESDRTDFLREVEVWHESRHPNIVPLFGACHVGEPCFMVCKYIAGGTLPDYLYEQQPVLRSRVWTALLGVTHGLQLLHSKDFVHGDLKGNNILMEGDTAMLTDFGMSFHGSGPQPQFDNLGAIRWRAPEFIATKKASFEADVYSLGMCIVEAVTGKLPWGMIPDLSVKWHLDNNKFLKQPKSMSDDEWTLVCAMCDFDPSKRMALAEVEKRISDFVEVEAEKEDARRKNARAAS